MQDLQFVGRVIGIKQYWSAKIEQNNVAEIEALLWLLQWLQVNNKSESIGWGILWGRGNLVC